MKVEHYSFTRGAEKDYGIFSIPNNLTKSQLDIVRVKLMSILGDEVERNLSIPKWILYKDCDFLLWGVCCENRLLASSHQKTAHKNRPIRGFFSIVITDFKGEKLKLPFDINYFRELYLKEVEAYWNQIEQHPNKTLGFIQGDFNYIRAAHNNYLDLLNTNIFQCQSLGELDKEGVIAAALTLDNVSLLIDNDNLQQATNKKGSFMNCLTSSVGFGGHQVKQQCPKCKKYVSSFTPSGVCFDCKKLEEVIKKEKEDMDEQIKIELENAQNKITELKAEIEIKCSQLKKKDLLAKILAVVSIILFIALLYTQDLFSLKLFESSKQETRYSPDNPRNKDRGRHDNNFMQHQEESFKFFESYIDVKDISYENFLIKVKSNVDNYEIKSDVDWIEILSKLDNQITIDIAANEQEDACEGKITVAYGNSNTDSVVIKQEGKCN